MMSSLKQHPRQLILSAASVVLLALFGIVAFLPERAPAVTEWELVPPPPSVATAQLKRVVGAFNGHLNGYFVWGVGGHTTTDTTGVVVRYDRYNWQPFSFGFGATKARRLHDVTQWLEDRSPANPSSSDVHHVWAVGESQAGAGQGGLWYSQTSSTTGTATVWDTCVQTGSSCDAVSFAGSETAPAELTSIDSLNATTLVAGDANCRVWLSNDAGRTWSQTAGAPNCPSGQGITAIRFGRDFTAGQDSVGNQLRHAYLWAVGEQTNRIWVSSNQGQTWVQHNLNVSARDWTDVAAIRDGTNLRVWAVGQSGAIRFLSCTIATQCLTPGRVFVDGAPGGTLGTGPLTSVTAMIDTTVTTPVTKAWATGGTLGGNDGVLWASQNATAGTNAVWRRQSTNTVNALFGVNVVNPTHGWAVGDGAALSQLSPGNVNGYGWIGSDTCANVCSGDIAACEQGGIICEGGVRRGQPLGWLSLNCANGNVCQTNDFNYGVNLKQKREEVGVETQCSDADQDPDVGALSGFAWVGASDLNQTIGGVSCASDPSVCRPVGWLAFERMAFCDGNPSVPCQSIADCTAYTPNTCNLAGSSPPLPPFEAPNAPSPTFSFRTACAKTITDTVQERYVQALYDYRFGRVEGWARFISSDSIAGGSGWVKLRGPYMCGTAYCTNDRTRTCTDNNDCRPPNTPESGFCDNSVPGAGSFGSCPTLAANNSHYVDCTDCTTHPGADPIDPSDDYLTCSICTHVNTDAWWNTNFTRRKQLTVTLPAGKFVIGQLYTLTYVLDADAYATAPNYDGLRVVYHSASGSVQLDRDIIHLSDGLEEIRFKSYADIDRGRSSDRYYLYYRGPGDPLPGPAPRNLDQVYWLFEDFSIDVFAGSNPLWAVAQAAGDPACSYAVVNESGNGKLRSTGATNNCIAYRKTPEFLDIIPGFMEADIRLDNRSPALQPSPQGSLITVAFSGAVIGSSQWWGINRTLNEVFIYNAGRVASATTSAPVSFGPRVYTLKAYTEAVGYNFVNPRRNIIWLDNTVAGQLDPVPLLDQQAGNNPYIVPSSFVGTHTWNANATWDNFKFWYGDVETDYALGAEEGYIPP
ncbi:MAG: hypothetical protein HYZ09_00425, partial [Candidatus Kerfeldbacteria bacterium]|nr:hypothetical protein [Candidatus Kerfeldbacteria bacterium]